MVASSSLDTLHAWLALGVPVPALMHMDTRDTMLTVVIPGANDREFVIYYEMAEPVGHFHTMAEIYRANEKTTDLMAASVNGKPPRFGGNADGSTSQGNGSVKFNPQTNVSCGGCFDFLNGPCVYSWTTCASVDTGCLYRCASACSDSAINCAACGASECKDWQACLTCADSAPLCAACGFFQNTCCNRWVTGCVDCGAP